MCMTTACMRMPSQPPEARSGGIGVTTIRGETIPGIIRQAGAILQAGGTEVIGDMEVIGDVLRISIIRIGISSHRIMYMVV